MKVPALVRRYAAATVGATALILASNAAVAGKQIPGAIAAEKVAPAAQPNSTAHFGCELRPFDIASNGGKLFCYGPDAIRKAYGINALINKGFTGKGRTIVIIDAFGSPTVATDLAAFDAAFGLPAPAAFNVVTMPGTPAFDPTNADMVGWTGEIALDTQWAHAVAPDAKIILVAAKSDFDEDLIAALNYALDHHLGDVVSMSFGESEAFLANPDGLDTIAAWQSAFQKARQQHVTLFASSGDSGSTNPMDPETVLPFQNVSFPASSTLVTSVGGTNLFFGTATNADPNGTYQGEQVWNDGFGAGGGGMSSLIDEPFSQLASVGSSVNKTLHKHRGVPDVAYNAGVAGGVIAAWGVGGGFFIFGGTSAGAPQWAGIIADLNQARGRPMGFLNDQLNLLGGIGALRPLFHDVTLGDNAFGGQPGFPAKPGYDLATGWGTPNFGLLGTILADPN